MYKNLWSRLLLRLVEGRFRIPGSTLLCEGKFWSFMAHKGKIYIFGVYRKSTV